VHRVVFICPLDRLRSPTAERCGSLGRCWRRTRRSSCSCASRAARA